MTPIKAQPQARTRVSVRSGYPSIYGVTIIDLDHRLLLSSTSETAPPASVMASKKYLPGIVGKGIVTVVDPALRVFAASAGTLRLPSSTSAPSKVASVDR